MNATIKTILGIVLFAALLILASFAYNSLTDNYRPDKSSEYSGENGEKENEKFSAPDFTVFDVEGNEVKLSDFAGKPVVLNFWASWCPPCREEMPHFNKVYNEMKAEVVFLMVDLVDGQRETREKGLKYLEDNGFAFPAYFDLKQDAAATYGINSIPATLFIDPKGNILTGYLGGIDEETLRSGIKLIKGEQDN